MNYIENLQISHLAIHQIIKDADTSNTTEKFGTNLITLTDEIKEILIRRLSLVLGANSNAIQMECDPLEQDSAYAKIIETLDTKSDSEVFSCSKELLSILAASSTHRKTPGGPVFVVKGTTTTLNRPFVAIIKAEFSSGFQIGNLKGRTKLQVIKDVFLTKEQKLYKVGFLTLANPELEIEKKYGQENLISFIFDVNTLATFSRDYASYFYKKFLGLKFRDTDERYTEKFFIHTKTYCLKKIEDKDLQYIHLNRLYVYLTSPRRSVVNVNTYIQENFDTQFRDAFRVHIANVDLPLTSFPLNTRFINSELSKRTFVFVNDNKVKIPYTLLSRSEVKFDHTNNKTIITLSGIPLEQ